MEVDKVDTLMELSAEAQGDDSGPQVLLLTLKDSGRDNVVEAVEKLALNAEIEYAENQCARRMEYNNRQLFRCGRRNCILLWLRTI